MKLLDYLKIDEPTLEKYISDKLIDRAHHDDFPLAILCYGRKAVYDNVWDSVTTKCRGLIYCTDTMEIIARPFEKFFNYGDPIFGQYSEKLMGEPEIYEKLDGFLCILYEWEGKQYIASKGSFHSIHAKWATAWFRERFGNRLWWNDAWKDYTYVFEGIMPDLRIVVNYGEEKSLRLLSLIHKETGEEATYEDVQDYAESLNLTFAKKCSFNLDKALKDANTNKQNFEGYVLVWRRPGQTPFRLKVKYVEYLRLHRMVTQVSPKRILEALSQGWDSVLAEYVENSTPEFKAYVTKWKNYLTDEYQMIFDRVEKVFIDTRKDLGAPPYGNELPTRKQWADYFTCVQWKDISAALFAYLDGNIPQVRAIIWKTLKNKVSGAKPLVDAHNT
jgi:RNA ligase